MSTFESGKIATYPQSKHYNDRNEQHANSQILSGVVHVPKISDKIFN